MPQLMKLFLPANWLEGIMTISFLRLLSWKYSGGF
jgi:hypothetical protein